LAEFLRKEELEDDHVTTLEMHVKEILKTSDGNIIVKEKDITIKEKSTEAHSEEIPENTP